MGIEKIGLTFGKKIIAWTRNGKSLLATRPVKVNTAGLKLAPKLEGDIVQISSSYMPTYEISSDLLSRLDAIPDGRKLFRKQYQEFWELRSRSVSHDTSTVIKEGDLLHGSAYDTEGLRSILKDGIVTGDIQYGKKLFFIEDGETFGCADFFINPKDSDISNYFGSFVTRNLGMRKAPEMNFLPRFNKLGCGNRQLGYIIDAEKLNQDSSILLKNSATPDNLNKSNLKDIIQGFPNYENLKAVLVGIPSNYINKIVVGNGITKGEIQEIKQLAKEYNLDLKVYDLIGNIL